MWWIEKSEGVCSALQQQPTSHFMRLALRALGQASGVWHDCLWAWSCSSLCSLVSMLSMLPVFSSGWTGFWTHWRKIAWQLKTTARHSERALVYLTGNTCILKRVSLKQEVWKYRSLHSKDLGLTYDNYFCLSAVIKRINIGQTVTIIRKYQKLSNSVERQWDFIKVSVVSTGRG